MHHIIGTQSEINTIIRDELFYKQAPNYAGPEVVGGTVQICIIVAKRAGMLVNRLLEKEKWPRFVLMGCRSTHTPVSFHASK